MGLNCFFIREIFWLEALSLIAFIMEFKTAGELSLYYQGKFCKLFFVFLATPKFIQRLCKGHLVFCFQKLFEVQVGDGGIYSCLCWSYETHQNQIHHNYSQGKSGNGRSEERSENVFDNSQLYWRNKKTRTSASPAEVTSSMLVSGWAVYILCGLMVSVFFAVQAWFVCVYSFHPTLSLNVGSLCRTNHWGNWGQSCLWMKKMWLTPSTANRPIQMRCEILFFVDQKKIWKISKVYLCFPRLNEGFRHLF